MRPTVSQYAEALETLSREGMSALDITKNFLGLLRQRGESQKIGAVLQQLEARALSETGAVDVSVVTARLLEPDMQLVLLKQAEQLFPGKTVQLTYQVDPAVIGGARFRTSETLYDATVKAQLNALKEVIRK